MKHTPGDWWFDMNLHVLNDPIGTVKVARVSGVNHEQAVANARLICAAPELLEALKACKERWDKYDKLDAPELGAAIDSAIAKAEGSLP